MDKQVQLVIFVFIGMGMLLALAIRADSFANTALGALAGAVTGASLTYAALKTNNSDSTIVNSATNGETQDTPEEQ